MNKERNINTEYIKTLLCNEDNEVVPFEDLLETENAFIQYAELHAVQPPSTLKNKIIDKLNRFQLNKQESVAFDIHNLPLLDEKSNWIAWQKAVAHIAPPTSYENVHLHPLESNDARDLFVVWVKDMVHDETHHDLIESFLILEGTCECYITSPDGSSKTLRLGAGEFITMQIGELHNIKITSLSPAKAILQWKKLAA